MRPIILSAVAAAGLTLAACDRPAAPTIPDPDRAPVVPPAEPVTAQERRMELQARSAEAQIEAQLNAQPAPAPEPRKAP